MMSTFTIQSGHIFTSNNTTVSLYNSSSSTTFTGINTVTNAHTNGAYATIVATDDFIDVIHNTKLKNGRKYILPDDAVIEINDDGNYVINDKDAKIIYKGSRIREFNKYMNAGDLIEEFIKDIGELGVTQGQLLQIPINVFFTWLITKSAIEDEDDIPADIPKIESMQEVKNNIKPKCNFCKRFLAMNKFKLGINFCNEDHLGRFMRKMSV